MENKMKKYFSVALFMFACVALFLSCKPQVPGKYIQPGDMEDILFDYHIAMGMVSENDTNDFQKRMYEASVLKKHGVTEAEFDSSLVYYTRHADRFQTIYENLSKRLSDEAVSLGAAASDVSNFGENANSGDTANVWREASSYVLATVEPNNVESFHIVADSAYHKGDRIIFSFDTQFIFQDGYKDGVAMLAVKLSNDSIVTRVLHISESTHYDISISDDENFGIKEIRGFISLQNQESSSQSTLKLMFVSNIRLIRCHIGKDKTSERVGTASENTNSADSTASSSDETNGGLPSSSGSPSNQVAPADEKFMSAPQRRVGSLN